MTRGATQRLLLGIGLMFVSTARRTEGQAPASVSLRPIDRATACLLGQ
jgi:hypothetical protein